MVIEPRDGSQEVRLEPKPQETAELTKGSAIFRKLFGRGERQLRGSPEACVIALASGKGGTGKSFLASNLAVAMYDNGLRVTLVDCDFGLGNDHLLLGVNPRLSVQHFLGGTATIDEVRVRTPYGPWLLPGGSGISRLADMSEQELLLLAKGMSTLAAGQDVLLFDASAGISPQSLLTLLASEQVVLVTNPEIAALTDAYALIKCLARQAQRPGILVVVNRVSVVGRGALTFEKLADVSRRFTGLEIQYLGEIPEDPAVTHRRLGQPPLVVSHPQCRTSEAVVNLLGNLEDKMGGLGPRPVNGLDTLAFRFKKYLTLQPRI